MLALLSLAYLFFIGSVLGWVLELVFRKFFSASNPEHKWINPGFCTGPYVPLYGFGLCTLYLLSALGERWGLGDSAMGRALVLILMTVALTAIEYAAGVLALRVMKVRLWDYSRLWGNLNGLICPLFSFFWGLLGAAYYFLAQPHVLAALTWLREHLGFSFVVGVFFGVFSVDAGASIHLTARLRRFARENGVIVRYEALKASVRAMRERAKLRANFFFPFRLPGEITERLAEASEALEELRKRK